jgi:hypothetical protein
VRLKIKTSRIHIVVEKRIQHQADVATACILEQKQRVQAALYLCQGA